MQFRFVLNIAAANGIKSCVNLSISRTR